MGMFDEIKCNVVLPGESDTIDNIFQTKEFDCNIDMYILEKDKVINQTTGNIEELPGRQHIEFYDGTYNYTAGLTDGIVTSIKRTPYSNKSSSIKVYFYYRFLPSGNYPEFKGIHEELKNRGIIFHYSDINRGRLWRIPIEESDKLPKDEIGPYLGDDLQGYSLSLIDEWENLRLEWKGSNWINGLED